MADMPTVKLETVDNHSDWKPNKNVPRDQDRLGLSYRKGSHGIWCRHCDRGNKTLLHGVSMTDAPLQICDACPGDCVDACFNDALIAVDGAVSVHDERCAGCGACLGACALEYLRLEHGVIRLSQREQRRGMKHDI